jgi:hypothetical protein
MTKILSTFLFAQPRFGFGVARLLDLGANFNYYNISHSPAEADAKALLADWYVVSDDLLNAMHDIDSEGCWPHAQEKAAPSVETVPTA